MTYPDGSKFEFMCDPENGTELMFKTPVEKEDVDSRY
jgi:hypothetical protein